MKLHKISQFAYDFIKRFFSTKMSRAAFLFVTPLFLSLVIFTILFVFNFRIFNIFSDYSSENTQEVLVERQAVLQDLFDKVPEITKIPASFLNFDVYVWNTITAKKENGEEIITLLNVEVLGKYSDGIQTGKVRKIVGNVNLNILSTLSLTRSLNIFEQDIEVRPLESKNSFYFAFLFPTLSTILFSFIFMFLFLCALMAVINFSIGFIRSGDPFRETFNKS